MKWFKDVIVDIFVVVTIVSAVILEMKWLVALVVGYTSLVLIFRVILYFNKSSNLQKKLSTNVPDWFFHLLYGFNSIFLLTNQWWFTGFAWAGVWFLAWLVTNKQA